MPDLHTMSQKTHGVVAHPYSSRPTDFLYRVSLKCLIKNKAGEVLAVKETGRDWWDLPGGGMDHGEGIADAIAREMQEEVNLTGEFAYKIIAVEEPAHLRPHNFWQLRLIFAVTPQTMIFSAGEDGDEIAFMQPQQFQHAVSTAERRIYEYSQLTPK